MYYYERHGEREGLVITSLNGGWVRDSLYKMYLAILLLPLIGCSATMLSVICIVFTAILSTFATFKVYFLFLFGYGLGSKLLLPSMVN